MIELLLSLPDIVGAAVAMVIAAVLGLAVYLIAYKLISKYQSDELKDPTGGLFRVVGMLVSLMLSLAFADVMLQMRAIENAIEREAVAISDTFNDLLMFDTQSTEEARRVLIEYTESVIKHEWPTLANDRLSQRTGALGRELNALVMDLKPANTVQERLWSRLLADVDAFSDHRLIRLDSTLAEPPVFVYVVMTGFLVTMACFGAYRPQGPLVALVSLYTVFIGFVLYLVLALSDPFQGAFSVDPALFETLVQKMRAKSP